MLENIKGKFYENFLDIFTILILLVFIFQSFYTKKYIYLKLNIVEYLILSVFLCIVGLVILETINEISKKSLNLNTSKYHFENEMKEEINTSYSIIVKVICGFTIALNIGEIRILLILTAILFFRKTLIKHLKIYTINNFLKKKYESANIVLEKKILEINNMNKNLEKKVLDRTEELKNKNQKLYQIANTDYLTQFPNRRKFIKYLDKLIEKIGNNDKFALVFMDLDRFKSVNDWYGHDIGDKLLIEVSNRLKLILDENDFIGRQGGDEFVIILKNIESLDDVIFKANKIITNFQKTFEIDGRKLMSTASIGIAIYPDVSKDRTELMKCSDIALCRAKEDGKNRYKIYEKSMKKESDKKLEIETNLQEALEKNEFKLFYQPQMDIDMNTIIGVEALIRWDSKKLGFINPGEFIPIAEENGSIIDIGDWVIKKACEDIKYLNTKYFKNLKVGINVSPKQFIAGELVEKIKKIIDNNNMLSNWIDIEITEACAIKNESLAIDNLNALKKLGVNISIDDFGMGYSSISYLRCYPINTLKIPLELIRGINANKQDYKIVQAIINMGKNMNLKLIAEGVEEFSQAELLVYLGCNQLQGYYFDRPMEITALEKKYFSQRRGDETF
ncbi:EAL domain-containing protein [Cetobacterium sp. 2A]|uniref:putative bifunctional diguanylate cyclase/phosphodiesterase n=1 Tax=Cetobacterium sp. 2A TaxID=2754723 RepID=UPI00163C61BF|nr:EAL domain-containing protein [Cetobacterium sp. 2A]MBC2857287.1 EAL domain-containing protein [Cetobacterium sp. 2A]